MKRIILCLLIAVLIAARGNTVFSLADEEKRAEPDPLHLYAQSAVLMDAATGRILYEKNAGLTRPMASTTKIMTCILALENGNPEDTVTASSYAASQPKVHLGVHGGETFKLGDLLYSLMLESHNDSAVMIAEHIGGSVEEFAVMMNQKARDLGCADTYFITPNGLDASTQSEDGQVKTHSTTAADLGTIMNYCISQSPEKEKFLKITGTRNYYFTDGDGKKSFNCTNHNALLTMMDGALSGKTGFTGGAGYSYVGTLKNENRMFTIALLGCGWPPHKTYKWADARKLFQYGEDNYHYKDVYREPEFSPIPVANGISPSGRISEKVFITCDMNISEEERHLPLLISDEEEITVSAQILKELEAPVKKGQAVGMVTYRLGGEVVKTYPVFAVEQVEKISTGWCLAQILKRYLAMPGIDTADFELQ